MAQVIGVAGTGRMGTAFARRLIETGYKVKVWNRNIARAAEAVAAGAAESDLGGIATCDAIIMSLTGGSAARDVLDELLALGLAGRLIIEMSTLLPDEAEELAETARTAGADFVHCPVGGTVAPALKGQLLGMAGGSPAAMVRAQPILGQLCRRVADMGNVSNAARMKLAINLPLAIYWQTLGESLALLHGAGVPDDLAISVIADSSAGPAVLKNRGQVVIDTLSGRDQTATFDVAGLAKDLGLALQLAETMGRELPTARSSAACYADAIASGLGGFDGASVSRRAARK
ncbi:NAD-binding protein [Rhodobacterales bacterium LSUCC0387]|nr:NAD-binding protein [Rhodobacterales bacterium LSUCC0387]